MRAHPRTGAVDRPPAVDLGRIRSASTGNLPVARPRSPPSPHGASGETAPGPAEPTGSAGWLSTWN